MVEEEILSFFSDGELYSWGCNSCGQLGIGRGSEQQQKPTLVNSLAGIPIAFIACGGNHSFAVSRSGKLAVVAIVWCECVHSLEVCHFKSRFAECHVILSCTTE